MHNLSEAWESDSMATFVDPETQPDSEDRWTAEQLGKAQRADKERKMVMGWKMASDERPSWEEAKRYGEEVREYWSQWKMLELREGVSHRHWVSSDGQLRWLQMISLFEFRKEEMRRAHCEAAGHLGVLKTLEQVRQRAFWKGWRCDVERYCHCCEVSCSYHRGKAPRQGRIHDMVVGVSWTKGGMDLTGRHPRSRRGNYYILAYLDHFTKFTQAYAIPNKEAETICCVLVEEIFPQFGFNLTDRPGPRN